MYGLRVLGEVVPEHVRILQMGLGITLLSVDEMGKLGRVTDEEDRGVVEDLVGEYIGRGSRTKTGGSLPSPDCPPLCGF